MNLFVVHKNPRRAAKMLCDQHVQKMYLESAQMLSSVQRQYRGVKTWQHRSRIQQGTTVKLYNGDGSPKMGYEWVLPSMIEDEVVYSRSLGYKNHSVTAWTRRSKANYRWHFEHLRGLLDEYQFRFGKYPITHLVLPYLELPPEQLPDLPLTKPALATGDIQPTKDDPVQAYREFVVLAKDFAVWEKKRKPPKWFGKMRKQMQRGELVEC